MEDTILHFVAHYGYIGIFGVLMIGIIGLPVPDEVLMTFTGYLVSLHQLRFLTTVLVAASGSIVGMSISFFVGHSLGLAFLQRYGSRVRITPQRLDKVQSWFQRFGRFAVTIGYFIPGVRHLTALSAGIGKWPYRSFLLYAVPGALAWAAVFVTAGMVVGEHWRTFSQVMHRYLLYGILLAAAGVLVWWLARRARRGCGKAL